MRARRIKIRGAWGALRPVEKPHSTKHGRKGYSRQENRRMAASALRQRDELIAVCAEENQAIAEHWRAKRRSGELEIERVVEESGAFGAARQRVMSRDVFDA